MQNIFFLLSLLFGYFASHSKMAREKKIEILCAETRAINLPWSLSILSLQFISNWMEQSEPDQPSMHTHLYSPSSSVHWPWREHPFSQPASGNWCKNKERKKCNKQNSETPDRNKCSKLRGKKRTSKFLTPHWKGKKISVSLSTMIVPLKNRKCYRFVSNIFDWLSFENRTRT